MGNLNEDIAIHDILNPLLWDLETNKLKPVVRTKILAIVAHFLSQQSIKIEPIDIQIVGSNASYNYTEHSDIDVHLIVNYETLSADIDLLSALFDCLKSKYNSKYDIKIKGLDVELYIQDVNSGISSNGIYSVFENHWIKFPKPIENIPQYDVSDAVDKWTMYINEILNDTNKEDVVHAINTLYLIRHNSINTNGEYGAGNQIFKEIRNAGLLDSLKDKLNELTSKELSLESFSKGQLVNSI